MMLLLWSKWLPLVTKHINRHNSRSYLDGVRDENCGGLMLLYEFHRLITEKHPFGENYC